MGVLIDFDSLPVARNTHRRTIVVRIPRRQTVGIEASSHGVIFQRCQNYRLTRLTNDLQTATNAISDIQCIAVDRKASRRDCIIQLNHETFSRLAFQSDPAEVMVIRNIDLIQHDMHNVRIVPHALRCHCFAADSHPVERIAAEAVVTYEWSLIVAESQFAICQTCLTALIHDEEIVQRRSVDIDARPNVRSEHVVQNYRLCSADKNRAGAVRESAGSVNGGCAANSGSITFKHRIADADIRLMHFHGVETREVAADRNHTACIVEYRAINTAGTKMPDINPTPIAG